MKRVALQLGGALLSIGCWILVFLASEQATMLIGRRSDLTEQLSDTVPLLGIPAYAVVLRLWYCWVDREPDGRGGLAWRHAFSGAALGGGYWFIGTVLLYGLFAGDPAPGTAPPDPASVYWREAAIVAVMLGLYAVLSGWLRRWTLRRSR